MRSFVRVATRHGSTGICFGSIGAAISGLHPEQHSCSRRCLSTTLQLRETVRGAGQRPSSSADGAVLERELDDIRAEAADLKKAASATEADASRMTSAEKAPVSAGAQELASGENTEHNDSGDDKYDWTEPTLEELDRSIPQVDCEFIANLIRTRTIRRKKFLERKKEVKAKVDSMSRRTASSVSDVGRFMKLGGFNEWGKVKNEEQEEGLTVLDETGETPILVSQEVLSKLTDEEVDLLYTTRPEYDDGFVLIDCRTVNEVTSWGIIEGSKVLPAHEMFEGFHMTPEDFQKEFGFPKPRPDQKVILYCQYGPRSLMAAQILSWMGYPNVLHFRDGYYEWSKQYNLLLRRWMEHDKETGNEMRRQAAFQAALELQREVAPEFNALPMSEAERYLIDETRSRGTQIVGEGVRLEAYKAVAELTASMGLSPTRIPGVIDLDGQLPGGADSRQKHLDQFLESSTGMQDGPRAEPPRTMGFGEAQEAAMTIQFGNQHPITGANIRN